MTAGSGADSLVLDLGADAINQCQTVTVSYAVPATNPIQDTDDIAAVGFTGFAVDNNSMVECPNLYSPVFGGDDPRMFSVEENVPLGTDVGVPVIATDADRRHRHIQPGHHYALRELFPDQFGDGPTADQCRHRARL